MHGFPFLWVRFGLTFSSLWNQSLWEHFGITAGSLWGHFGGPLRNHFGVTSESLWGHFGITSGSLPSQFAITSDLTLATLLDHFEVLHPSKNPGAIGQVFPTAVFHGDNKFGNQ